jgi:PAS domain-containing protein
MSKIQKDSINEKRPQDYPDSVSEKVNAEPPGQSNVNENNPEQVKLADLQEIERRFQTVFEAAPIGIAIANPEGYFLEVNDAFVKMLGYSRQEVAKITFVDITYPDDRQETRRLRSEMEKSITTAAKSAI